MDSHITVTSRISWFVTLSHLQVLINDFETFVPSYEQSTYTINDGKPVELPQKSSSVVPPVIARYSKPAL